MLYPYVSLPDGTEINHSHIIETDGVQTVEVHFERPNEEGFDSARCVLPYCEWKFCEGFLETEKVFFEEFLRSNAHLIHRCAEMNSSEQAPLPLCRQAGTRLSDSLVGVLSFDADKQSHVLKVSGVRPMADHKLWVRFNTGEAKIFDFRPLLSEPAFLPLADPDVFREVCIDYGVTVWQNGDIDIAPEALYFGGVIEVENA